MDNVTRYIIRQDLRGKVVVVGASVIMKEESLPNCSKDISGVEFRRNSNGTLYVVVFNMDLRRKRLEIQGSSDFRYIYRVTFIS